MEENRTYSELTGCFYHTEICFVTVPTNVGDEIASGGCNEEAQEEPGKLKCPICSVEYERSPENARNLVLHVDEHLVEELKCPVCFITFNVNNQNAYENHVNVSNFYLIS